jgi:hemerythrin-like domain-containing protein
MTNEPLADVRDMYMSHTMFRREIGLAPALIRDVADGNVERAATVADHLGLVDTVLHHHHVAEDTFVWPRLVERAGEEAEEIVQVMEQQHGSLDKLLDEVRAGLAQWPHTADAELGDVLADKIEQLHSQLVAHLAAEEDLAIPLIEKHITATEWAQMIGESAADVPPEQMPLVFGMVAYEGDPDTVRDIIAQMPPEVSGVIGELAAAAYAAQAQRVHGTATPARIGARAVTR